MTHCSSTLCLLVLTGLLLSACGGGSSSGKADSGQRPDPVVVDLPIAYIERPLPRDEESGELIYPDILDPLAFNPGAAVFIRERATAIATPINITDQAFEEGAAYDVKDLSVHPAGDRLLFAMRAPLLEDVPEEEQPTWNIWEYHLTLKQLRRVIESDIVAEAGHDLSPGYLPDDRIVFASTRQTRSRAILLDDNKPQYSALEESRTTPALVLHVMENDGTGIEQISYNQSHDLYPLVLQDGRILYTRWDNMARRSPASDNNRLSFYTINPDGTQQQFHYGYHSLNEDPEPPFETRHRLFRPQQLPDGRLVAIYMPNRQLPGGDMLVIDAENYTENTQPLSGPEIDQPAQTSLSVLPIRLDGEPSIHGLFAALHPLYDGTNRLLVSWSQCRLQLPTSGRLVPCTQEWLETEDIEQAPPFFGLWIYNLDDQTQQPVVLAKDDVIYTEAVTLEPRTPPDYLPAEPDPDLAQEGVGVLHIRSVYDMDGTDLSLPRGLAATADPAQTSASQRQARFLRLIKPVSMPDRNTLQIPGFAFGFSPVMREILGYVPIEPDGSVKARIPADVAFTFEIVDASGRRLAGNLGARHQNWLQLRPGEVRECKGCHNADSTLPHGRAGAGPASINPGAFTSGLPFPNTEPELVAEMGETMAEVRTRVKGLRKPSVDLVFDDEWTDPAVRPKDASFALRYLDLANSLEELSAPTTAGCLEPEGWHSLCRVIINYPDHVQPLWERPRLTLDGEVIVSDNTCVSCHSTADADNMPQVPAGQLDLTRAPSPNNNDHMTSFRELLTGDVELEIVEGALVVRLVETGEFERDEDGQLILDELGNPIPILTTVGVGSSMVAGSARNSGRFFNRFYSFDAETQTFDHRGLLNGAELKFLSEWLDLGAAYYNNPFDAVVEDE